MRPPADFAARAASQPQPVASRPQPNRQPQDDTQNLSASPAEPRAKSMWDTQAFIILPVLLIVLAVGFFMFLQFDLHTTSLHLLQNTTSKSPTATNNASNSYSTSNPKASNNATNITTSVSSSNGNVNTSCPCLTGEQFSGLFNNSLEGTYNIVAENQQGIGISWASSAPPPSQQLAGSTRWYVLYNFSGGNAGETVDKISNATKLYLFSTNYSYWTAGKTAAKIGSTNGFTYSYFNFQNGNLTDVIVSGYKGNFYVLLTIGFKNSNSITIQSPNSIATMISSTI